MDNRDHNQEFLSDTRELLRLHVTLVYPYARTQRTIDLVYQLAGADSARHNAPSERAWLLRLARVAALTGDLDNERARDRNDEAVLLALYDAAMSVRGDATLPVVESLRRLARDQRELLRLWTVEDLTIDELAWILAQPHDCASETLRLAEDALYAAQISDSEEVE